MSEGNVDPALYRLRAFELDWVRRLEETILPPRHSPEFAEVFAEEFRLWLAQGREAGYFPEAQPIPKAADLLEMIPSPAAAGDFFLSGMDGLTLPQFAEELSLARDDLTLARMELLELVVFSPSEQWAPALEAVERFADVLDDDPHWHPPTELVDSIAWSLDGSESERSRWASPASWRMGEVGVVIAVGIDSTRTSARSKALQHVRRRIFAAMEYLAADEPRVHTERIPSDPRTRARTFQLRSQQTSQADD